VITDEQRSASWWADGAFHSAEVVVPLLVDRFTPKSVIDVGCGLGAWLSVFQACDVTDILGIDGSYVDPERLLIAPNFFMTADLEKPIKCEKRFDLAVCTEVAEHLSERRARGLVADLVSFAPIIVFSAAIPGQGGVGHVNERLPRYWADMFAAHGYEPYDVLRPLIWDNERVEWWYRQNLLLYSAKPVVEARWDPRLTVIHPASLQGKATYSMTLRQLARAFPDAAHGAIRHRIHRYRHRIHR
jgi:hypothetical protein